MRISNTSLRRGLLSLFTLLLVLALVPSIFAQDRQNFCRGAETLGYGDSTQGIIDDDTPATIICFDGEAGDTVTITLSATSGDLDTYLALTDPFLESVFVENDDMSSSTRDSQIEYTLEEDGTYAIFASRFEFAEGRTEGNYMLTLEVEQRSLLGGDEGDSDGSGGGLGSALGGSSDDSASQDTTITEDMLEGFCTTEERFMAYGDMETGSLNDEASGAVYCFVGSAGDTIDVTVTTTSGDLDTVVVLGDPALETVFTQDGDGADNTTDSSFSFTLESDGVYLILVTRVDFAEGKTAGSYELDLQVSGDSSTTDSSTTDSSTTDSSTTADASGTRCESAPFIAYGESIGGEISDDSPGAVACFAGSEGDVVTITMERTTGNLDSLLLLTDANLETTFAENDDRAEGDRNSEIVFTLPADGIYLIVATRYQLVEGTTSGRFEITLEAETASSDDSTTTDSDSSDECDSGGLGGLLGSDCETEEPEAEDSDDSSDSNDSSAAPGDTCADYPLHILSAYQWGIPGETAGSNPALLINVGCTGVVYVLFDGGEPLLLNYDIATDGTFSFTDDSGSSPVTLTTTSLDETNWELFTGNSTITLERLDEGQCEQSTMRDLIQGAWSTTGSDPLIFDFGCNGIMFMTFAGETSSSSYTFDGDTIRIAFTEGDLVLQDVNIVPGETLNAFNANNENDLSLLNILSEDE